MHRTALVRRVTLSGLAAVGLVALGATSASAHVTITPSTTAAGATAVLRFEVPHGCEGSATTGLSVRIPDGVTDVTATSTDRWAVDRTADGLTYTTDVPLPDGEHDEVEFELRLPDDEGATLVFPVVQRCEEGEAAWTEVAEQGEDHDALERPAPVLVVTAGDAGSGAGSGAGSDAGSAADAEATAHAAHSATPEETTDAGTPGPTVAAEAAGATADPAPGSPLITYGAVGLLAAAVLAGGAVVLRRRRRP